MVLYVYKVRSSDFPSGKPIERSRCYPIVMPYTIAISQQAPMAFVIALDLLIALIFPIRYRSISTLPYVALLCLPGWIYSLFFMIYGWIMMNDDLVHLCNVVVGLEPSVSSLWTFSNVVVNVAIFFGCICFSQNFYVCIWRSLDYRRAFMEQLDILRCRNSSKRTIAIGASTADRKTGAGWVQ
ncbi:hypothetical protein ANCCEY_01603 [Ancylostoma ceylanicum]|uniref:G-protein coupled receptors family 1 profile domain-containing protein n=1 Tax=Ancylostoma ceylanicum TaxID=53326 RepID=A0A0D6M5D4_9BILA|nr:hypothetical protein ANCCEY_01603 [Ancylostoma ceylanicum]